MRVWLQDTVKFLSETELSVPLKLAVAVFFMCCSYKICKDDFADLSSITLLKMMALPPNGDGFEFLGSLMKEKRSQYAMRACIIMYSFNVCICIIVMCIMFHFFL